MEAQCPAGCLIGSVLLCTSVRCDTRRLPCHRSVVRMHVNGVAPQPSSCRKRFIPLKAMPSVHMCAEGAAADAAPPDADRGRRAPQPAQAAGDPGARLQGGCSPVQVGLVCLLTLLWLLERTCSAAAGPGAGILRCTTCDMLNLLQRPACMPCMLGTCCQDGTARWRSCTAL